MGIHIGNPMHMLSDGFAETGEEITYLMLSIAVRKNTSKSCGHLFLLVRKKTTKKVPDIF